MRPRYWLGTIGVLLVGALAFSQTNQPTTGQQPTAQPSTAQQPADGQPTAPQSVADAARASRKAHESAPPSKVFRNKDLSDGTHAGSAAAGNSSTTALSATQPRAPQAASHPAAKTAAEIFQAQGNILKNQVLVQKGKILDIQNQIESLKRQFAAWSTDFSQDEEAPLCWSSLHDSPYYQDWCDTGKNLDAQYKASQQQLAQEKARLEQMQEDIRRKGYGTAVYDPD